VAFSFTSTLQMPGDALGETGAWEILPWSVALLHGAGVAAAAGSHGKEATVDETAWGASDLNFSKRQARRPPQGKKGKGVRADGFNSEWAPGARHDSREGSCPSSTAEEDFPGR